MITQSASHENIRAPESKTGRYIIIMLPGTFQRSDEVKSMGNNQMGVFFRLVGN